MTESVAAVVIGAGLMGAAAAWSLAREGRSVVLVDQFAAGHANGSSHGSARIVRRAYGDPDYSRWAGRSLELWAEVEHGCGRRLIEWYGGCDFGARRDVHTVAAHFTAAGVAHEVLPATEAEARWPGMRFDGDVVFSPQAGVLDAADAVEAFVGLASAAGADVRRPWPVERIELDGELARVHSAGGGSLTAPLAVVAAGGWVTDLVHGLVELPPLRVTEESVFHFPRRDPSAPPWPSTIHEDVIAAYTSPADVTVARPATASSGCTPPAGRARRGAARASRTRRPATGSSSTCGHGCPDSSRPRAPTTCLYTSTPNEEFLLDRVGPLLVCSPCSGHGAKFAPLVGEWVTALVDRPADVPGRFRLAAHREGRPGAVSL